MVQKHVLLMGGVGNRLFQVARAKDLLDLGHSVNAVDIEDLKLLSFIAYRLLGWSKHGSWLHINELCTELGVKRTKPKLKDRIRFGIELFKMRVLGQKQHYNSRLSTDGRTYQIGYFQNMASVSQKSISVLAGALKELLGISSSRDELAVVHIRGGDFANADRLDPMLVKSFFNAMMGNCICVTNDAEYVKQNYSFLKLSVSGSVSDDFSKIATAQTIMPSNSTFCFWACAIAVKIHHSQLYRIPEDSYWQHLSESEI